MKLDYTTDSLDGFSGFVYTANGAKSRTVYDDGDLRIEVGDPVYWEDPDAGSGDGECPLIARREVVARVKEIQAVAHDDGETYSIEVEVRAPVRRLNADAVTFPEDAGKDVLERFEAWQDSQYAKYMMWETHYAMDHPIQVEKLKAHREADCWYDAGDHWEDNERETNVTGV